MKQLWPHQTRAIKMLRESIRLGKKAPILQLPTGSGKTLIAANILRNARDKGKRVMFVVDAIQLIDQTVQAFYDEGLHGIGVIQADHPMTDYAKPIQVASVQTLARRKLPEFDMYLNDEAHVVYKVHQQLRQQFPDRIGIGLSATPWTKGLGLLYDDLVRPASIRELTDLKKIARLKAYRVGCPDLDGVKIKGGEYDETQVEHIMGGNKVVADIIDTWKQLGEWRPTLGFAVNLAHAEVMRDRFVKAGIGAEFIEGDTPLSERNRIRARLDAGGIHVVWSVGTMIKGVDWKFGCIIDAQPTRNLQRHAQKLGRLRYFDDWESGLVLDHAGNLWRLPLPIDIDIDRLDTSKKGEKSVEDKAVAEQQGSKECPSCKVVAPKIDKRCSNCGYEGKRFSEVEEGAGKLVAVEGGKSGPKKPEWTPEAKERFYRECLGWCHEKGKPENQAAGKYKDRFGHWPPRKNGLTPLLPSLDTESWIKASQIRYAKGRAKRAA